MVPNGPVWDVYYYTSRPRESANGPARARTLSLPNFAFPSAAPWRNLRGARGGRVVVNGARPLWHSARFPDPTFSTNFLRHHHRPKTVSKIDLAGSRRDFSRLVAFSENCPGSIPPRRALCQRGAPHEEPLLYSARFASPGMLIFAHLWPLWHAGQNIKNHVEGLQE